MDVICASRQIVKRAHLKPKVSVRWGASHLCSQTEFAHADVGIICLHRVQPTGGITDEKFVVVLLNYRVKLCPNPAVIVIQVAKPWRRVPLRGHRTGL